MKGNGVATAPASKNGKPKKPVKQAEEAPAGAPEYEVVDGCTVWITRDRKGRPCDVPIANFEATIVRAVAVDDGADESRHFDIDVAVGGETFFVRGLLAARLRDRGLLLSVDGERETLTVRRTLDNARCSVLHLAATLVLGENDESADDDVDGGDDDI
jgi:hypothetical protein